MDRIDAQVDEVAAQALVTGGAITAAVGVSCAIGIFALAPADQTEFFRPPLAFSLVGGALGMFMRAVGRRRAVARWAWLLVVALPLLPTTFFVFAQTMTSIGAAPYVTGPFSHLYAFTVVATGFLLRPRASVLAGVIAAAGMMLSWALAREDLVRIVAHAPELQGDLVIGRIWGFKAVMLVGVGGATAGIAVIARRLVSRVLAEERETQAVSKLFGEFVSADVRDKILKERGGLKSERRTVAVLFSDLRGFTTYSEQTDPAVVVERLNAYFERMVEAVEREGGVVDKFIGDAVMATFGGVVPLASPASSALRAARAMRASLTTLNAAWAAEGVPPFDNGIGLHFGEVIEGPLGSARRREYTVIGDTVNTASRLEGLTKDKGAAILASQSLVDALAPDERVGLVDLGEAHVKGRGVALHVWGGS